MSLIYLAPQKIKKKGIIKKVSCVPTSLPERKGTVTVDFQMMRGSFPLSLNSIIKIWNTLIKISNYVLYNRAACHIKKLINHYIANEIIIMCPN
jgi:hypothetical protein